MFINFIKLICFSPNLKILIIVFKIYFYKNYTKLLWIFNYIQDEGLISVIEAPIDNINNHFLKFFWVYIEFLDLTAKI